MAKPEDAGLNSASIEHMRRMLLQTLAEAEVVDQQAWVGKLMHILVKVAGSVLPDVRHGDDIDIREYIKIKKIPGGAISDSEYVSGIVCTKKAIHKRMLRTLVKPRILLITFSLEYQRVENQFVSLETLVAQEEDHIKNLVARVMTLKPDIVLVQKTVSRIALELLLKAGVIVVYDVKPSALVNIARFTTADIIYSIDKLSLNPSLGSCERFSFKTFVNAHIPGMRKTFMFFEGCPEQYGCSVVLRGADSDQLSRVKRVLDLMIFVVYNLKLETSLLRDRYAATPNVLPDPATASHALKQFQQTILSGSPCVKFPPPYLLVKMKDTAQAGLSLGNVTLDGYSSIIT
eukprot:jgi/Hompol1/3398/HPOL_003222-RA